MCLGFQTFSGFFARFGSILVRKRPENADFDPNPGRNRPEKSGLVTYQLSHIQKRQKTRENNPGCASAAACPGPEPPGTCLETVRGTHIPPPARTGASRRAPGLADLVTYQWPLVLKGPKTRENNPGCADSVTYLGPGRRNRRKHSWVRRFGHTLSHIWAEIAENNPGCASATACPGPEPPGTCVETVRGTPPPPPARTRASRRAPGHADLVTYRSI